MLFHIALADSEVCEEFDRLKGTNVSRKGSPLELAIDDGSGRYASDMLRFRAFTDDLFSRLELPN